MSALAVLTGRHFMNGDQACAEGALAADCRFFAGTPITPSTEIAERLARRMPEIGRRPFGSFILRKDSLRRRDAHGVSQRMLEQPRPPGL